MGKLTKKKPDVTIQTVDFNELVGSIATLYPCPNFPNKFQLGEIIFEVIEDENDGYRSMMEQVMIVGRKAKTVKELAKITIRSSDKISGFELVDNLDGHVWLSFGTDYTDGYYPFCVFNWIPKKDTYEALKELILK